MLFWDDIHPWFCRSCGWRKLPQCWEFRKYSRLLWDCSQDLRTNTDRSGDRDRTTQHTRNLISSIIAIMHLNVCHKFCNKLRNVLTFVTNTAMWKHLSQILQLTPQCVKICHKFYIKLSVKACYRYNNIFHNIDLCHKYSKNFLKILFYSLQSKFIYLISVNASVN